MSNQSNNDGSNQLFNFDSYRSYHASSSSSSFDEPVYRGLALNPAALEAPTLQHSWWQSTAANQSTYPHHSAQVLSGKQQQYQEQQAEFDFTPSQSNQSKELYTSAPATFSLVTLKDEPLYVERYTSFYSFTPISSLLSSLSTAFSSLSTITHSSLSLHFELDSSKGKYRCIGYDMEEGKSVEMIVRIYRAKEESNMEGVQLKKNKNYYHQGQNERKVVEFQRRCGCVVTMNRIYSHLYHLLEAVVEQSYTGIVRKSILSLPAPPPLPTTTTATAVAPAPSAASASIVPDDELISLLSRMLTSGEYSCMSTACSLLSVICSPSSSFCSLSDIHSERLLDLVLSSSIWSSGDHVMQRGAAMALLGVWKSNGMMKLRQEGEPEIVMKTIKMMTSQLQRLMMIRLKASSVSESECEIDPEAASPSTSSASFASMYDVLTLRCILECLCVDGLTSTGQSQQEGSESHRNQHLFQSFLPVLSQCQAVYADDAVTRSLVESAKNRIQSAAAC